MFKSKYSPILFARILELFLRFIFLFMLIRSFTVEEYGKISFVIALFQGLATFIFSANLQVFSFLTENKKQDLFRLCLAFTVLTGLLIFIFSGHGLSVFLFYSLNLLLTAWYTSHERQVYFSLIRAISFLPMALHVLYSPRITQSEILCLFYLSTVVLMMAMPFRVLWGPISLPPLSLVSKRVVHSFMFQASKPLERIIFQFFLSDEYFGYYSLFRDITNAINLVLFSSYYQLYFKKWTIMTDQQLALLFSFKKLIKIFFLIGLLFIAASFIGEPLQDFMNHILNLNLNKYFLLSLLIIIFLDLKRAFLYMYLESRRDAKNCILADVIDLMVLILIMLMTSQVTVDSYILFVSLIIFRILTTNFFMSYLSINLMSKSET